MLYKGTALPLICCVESCLLAACLRSSPPYNAQCRLDRRGFQIEFRIQLPLELYIKTEVWHPRKFQLNVRRYSVVMFMFRFATLSVFSVDIYFKMHVLLMFIKYWVWSFCVVSQCKQINLKEKFLILRLLYHLKTSMTGPLNIFVWVNLHYYTNFRQT
jgi:hypothetical protein